LVGSAGVPSSGGTSSVGGGGATGGGGTSGGGGSSAGNAGNAGQGAAAAGSNGGDAGGAGGAPSGCSGLFCEDFESGAFAPAVWNVQTSGGQSALVQKTKVAHGTYAAQFHALPNVLSYDLILTKNAPAALRGHHFGRAYFFVTPKPPAQHMSLLFAASAGFPKFKRLEVASYQGGWQMTSVNQTGINSGSAALPGTTETYAMGGALPVEQWLCLEWEFNDSPDEIHIFVNGKDDAAFTNIKLGGVTTGQVGGFSDFGFGYYIWHPVTYPFDVFYDDIVLDTKRVGCLPGTPG
jgi:hypothetical protein